MIPFCARKFADDSLCPVLAKSDGEKSNTIKNVKKIFFIKKC